jgi:2-haloacid dehalogenase
MMATKFKWSDIRVLTFDCYGTLIDWEKGLLDTLIPVLLAHNIHMSDENALGLFAELEQAAERGPYQDYKSVLRSVMDGFGARLAFQPCDSERECLVHSLKHWMPFPDTVDTLQILKSTFKLAVVSNIDDDLFSFTQQRLDIRFDWVITAEQVKSYKPSLNNFLTAFKRIGIPQNQIVHIAQSLYHDIAPANQIGISSVWVNRRLGQKGLGATVRGDAQPDMVVPDLHSLIQLIRL